MEWLPAFPGWDLPCGPGRFLERHPEITRVALYLDNDLAGRVNARKIKALLKSDQRFSKSGCLSILPAAGKTTMRNYSARFKQSAKKNTPAARNRRLFQLGGKPNE